MAVEHVFKALADHHRRHLIDLLQEKDGQTLNELCAHFTMTRFGVMKHLDVLEGAGLITTKKIGREKRHYLNRDAAAWAIQYRQFWEQRFDRLEEVLLKVQEQEKEDEPDKP